MSSNPITRPLSELSDEELRAILGTQKRPVERLSDDQLGAVQRIDRQAGPAPASALTDEQLQEIMSRAPRARLLGTPEYDPSKIPQAFQPGLHPMFSLAAQGAMVTTASALKKILQGGIEAGEKLHETLHEKVGRHVPEPVQETLSQALGGPVGTQQYGRILRGSAESQDARRRNAMWNVIRFATLDNSAAAGIALAAVRGDPWFWNQIAEGITQAAPYKVAGALGYGAAEGIQEKERRPGEKPRQAYFQDVLAEWGLDDETQKIRLPYLPDFTPADFFGLLGDLYLSPTAYLGFGALTKSGKLARAYEAAAKTGKLVKDSELGEAVTKAMLSNPEFTLKFQPTFVGRLQARQQRWVVLEHPFRVPRLVRLGDVESVAKAGDALREMAPFIPASVDRLPVAAFTVPAGAAVGALAPAETPEERLQHALTGAGVGLAGGTALFKQKGQFGVTGGTKITLGHFPGSRVYTPNGFVRKVFNAERGIRDKRLGEALLSVPILKLPSYEPFSVFQMEGLGIKEAEVWTSQLIQKATGRLRESESLPGYIVNAIEKGFVPYYRPPGVDPVAAEQVVSDLRVFVDGFYSSREDIRQRLREAFSSEDATGFSRKAIPILRAWGLNEDGFIIPFLKRPIPKAERVALFRSLEEGQKLTDPGGEVAAELIDRAMRMLPSEDAAIAEEMAGRSLKLSSEALEDGLDTYRRTLAVNVEDIGLIRNGLEPKRRTLFKGDWVNTTPEQRQEMVGILEKENTLLERSITARESAIQDLGASDLAERTRRPPEAPPEAPPGAPAVPRRPKPPTVSDDFVVDAHGTTGGEVKDELKDLKKQLTKKEAEVKKAQRLAQGKTGPEIDAVAEALQKINRERADLADQVDRVQRILEEAGARETWFQAVQRTAREAMEHPGAKLKAVEYLPEAQAELARLQGELNVVPPAFRDDLLRAIDDLQRDSVASFFQDRIQDPAELAQTVRGASEQALRVKSTQEATEAAAEGAKAAAERARTLAQGAEPGEHEIISTARRAALEDAVRQQTDLGEGEKLAGEVGVQARRPVETTGDDFADDFAGLTNQTPDQIHQAAWGDPQSFQDDMIRALRATGAGEDEIQAVDFSGMQRRIRRAEATARIAGLPDAPMGMPQLGLKPEAVWADLRPRLADVVTRAKRAMPEFDPGFVGAQVVGPTRVGQYTKGSDVDVMVFYTNPDTPIGRLEIALRDDPALAALGGGGSSVPATPVQLQGHLLMQGETPASVAAALSPSAPGVPGLPTTAYGIYDPNHVYEFRYKLVDRKDLVVSHTLEQAENPAYPVDLQPRFRDRVASQRQINKIAAAPNPDLFLDDVRQLDAGSPIIGSDNIVESGNGRLLGLDQARETNPQGAAHYQEALKARIAQYGIDPKAAEGMEFPILTRERTTVLDDAQRVKFTEEANARRGLGMAAAEKAPQDARRISDSALSGITVGSEETVEQALKTASNRQFVREFLAAMPGNEAADLMDESGNINSDGIRRIKAAIFAKTFPGAAGKRLTTAFFESIDPGIRRIESGVFSSLPQLAKSEAMVRAGDRAGDLAFGEDLSKAVDALARTRATGISVEEFLHPEKLQQTAMFGREQELTPLQGQILEHLDSISNSPKAIRKYIGGYSDAVLHEPNPRQATLLGPEPTKTKEQILKEGGMEAFAETGPTVPEGGDLFAQPGLSPELASIRGQVDDAISSVDVLRKNPQHLVSTEPGDSATRMWRTHWEKVEGAKMRLAEWRQQNPDALPADVSEWENLQHRLESASPSDLKPGGETLGQVTDRIQGKPQKLKPIKSKVNRPLKATGESVVDLKATPQAIRDLMPGGKIENPTLESLDGVQSVFRRSVVVEDAKGVRVEDIPDATSISEFLKSKGVQDVTAIGHDPSENSVRLVTKNGDSYEFMWGKPSAGIGSVVTEAEKALREGKSVSNTIIDQVKSEDGQVDREFFLNVWKAVNRIRNLRRQIATEQVDDLIRFSPRFEKKMLQTRQEMIGWLDDMWAQDLSWNHGSGYIYQYAPHVPIERTKMGSFLGRGAIKDYKAYHEYRRSILQSATEANHLYRDTYGRDLFQTDALPALHMRMTASAKVAAVSQFIREQVQKHGVRVSAIRPEEWESQLEVWKKGGATPGQIKKAKKIIARMREIFPEDSPTKTLLDAKQAIVDQHGGLKEIKWNLKSIPEIKEYGQLRTDLEAILPDVAVYMPKGEYRRIPLNAISAEDLEAALKEGGVDARASDAVKKNRREILATWEGLRTEKGKPLIKIPLHKVRQIMALDPMVEAYLMPAPVADALNRGIGTHIEMGKELWGVFKYLDRLQNAWKGTATVMRPIFFTRNFLSAVWQNILDGFSDPALYMQALSVQQRQPGWKFKTAYNLEYDLKEVTDLINRYNVAGRGWGASDLPLEGMGPGKVADTLNPLSPRFMPVALGRRFNTVLENNVRIATFLDGLYRGMSPEQAALRVKRLQFDYSELTTFERDVLKRLLPFYKWTRANIPLQIHYLLTRPAKWTGATKIMRAFQENVPAPADESILGEEADRSLPIRVRQNKDGTYQYWYMASWWPGADLFRMMNPGAELLGMLTPFLKAPLELVAHKSFYWDAPTEKYPGETGYFLGRRMRRSEIQLLKNIVPLSELDKLWFRTILPGKETPARAIVESAIGRTYRIDFLSQAGFRIDEINRDLSAQENAQDRELEKNEDEIAAGKRDKKDLHDARWWGYQREIDRLNELLDQALAAEAEEQRRAHARGQ